MSSGVGGASREPRSSELSQSDAGGARRFQEATCHEEQSVTVREQTNNHSQQRQW